MGHSSLLLKYYYFTDMDYLEKLIQDYNTGNFYPVTEDDTFQFSVWSRLVDEAKNPIDLCMTF